MKLKMLYKLRTLRTRSCEIIEIGGWSGCPRGLFALDSRLLQEMFFFVTDFHRHLDNFKFYKCLFDTHMLINMNYGDHNDQLTVCCQNLHLPARVGFDCKFSNYYWDCQNCFFFHFSFSFISSSGNRDSKTRKLSSSQVAIKRFIREIKQNRKATRMIIAYPIQTAISNENHTFRAWIILSRRAHEITWIFILPTKMWTWRKIALFVSTLNKLSIYWNNKR